MKYVSGNRKRLFYAQLMLYICPYILYCKNVLLYYLYLLNIEIFNAIYFIASVLDGHGDNQSR